MEEQPQTLEDLKPGVQYRFSDLSRILKNLGLNHSIYTIRDYESWKCIDYKCSKRHNTVVTKCDRCGGKIREPKLPSPRTRGGTKGIGHRRYLVEEIIVIAEFFGQREELND